MHTCFRSIGPALALLLATAAPLASQGAGDAASGRGLAQQWCAECHAIAPPRPVGPNAAAPTFPELAGDPAMTPARIRAVLRAPHRAMPAAALNDTQISDLIAYIATLVAR